MLKFEQRQDGLYKIITQPNGVKIEILVDPTEEKINADKSKYEQPQQIEVNKELSTLYEAIANQYETITAQQQEIEILKQEIETLKLDSTNPTTDTTDTTDSSTDTSTTTEGGV